VSELLIKCLHCLPISSGLQPEIQKRRLLDGSVGIDKLIVKWVSGLPDMAKPTVSDEAAFLRISNVVRRLFHQLRAVSELASPAADGFTVSHRAVLESLYAGPQTVPALAKARPVARQHIQVLVNKLLELGLVETLANPAHRRSQLVALTSAGKRRFEAIRKAERALLRRAKLPLSAAELLELARRLELLSEGLHAWVSTGPED
jgi:DNA-binding MarR family transcriptional regulator